MKKGFILFFALGLALSGFAQKWDSIPGRVGDPRILYSDTINNYMYTAGTFNTVGGKHMQGIARWNGVKWDSLGYGIDGLSYYTGNSSPQSPFTITNYQGKLYVGGVFSSLGNVKSPCLGTWDGFAWDSLPIQPFKGNLSSNDGVLTSAVINNKLYIGGWFDTIAGKPGIIGIAQWDGINWGSLNFPNLKDFYYVSTICEYKGSIYVGGNFCNTVGDTNSSILRWDGAIWHSVGGGIQGLSVHINSMVVYKGELYVAGYFFKKDGNIGDDIQRWNGTNWKGVGGGVGGYGQIFQLMIYNDKLYALGSYDKIGGIPTAYIAEWDSIKWCSLGSTFDNVITGGCIYNDSLYICGGFKKIDNTPIYQIAKWMGGNYVDSCGVDPTSVNDIITDNERVEVYPNPSTGIFTIKLSNSKSEIKNIIELYNMFGEKVLTQNMNSTSTQIDLSDKADGVYLYRLISSSGNDVSSGKFIIQ
jgi:hypothetical protein